jgi:hypothetical protein
MPRLRSYLSATCRALTYVFICTLLCAPTLAAAAPSQARPQLSLPTPPGEAWKVIQGYGCGTHNSWDRYSLDLANADGRTSGAPVRAAADGVIFIWVKKSGTLIIYHGDGFYTQYTHMASAKITTDGTFVRRGENIGTAGDRGAPGTPHLHLTAFTAKGSWASNRQSVPLSFVEGYNLPDIGGCSQHQGLKMTASGEPVPEPPKDNVAPTLAPLPEPIHGAAGQPVLVQWPAATDDNVGVAGYRLYIGPDAAGTSEWFTPETHVELPSLSAGTYLLRLQALDAAGNQGDWITAGEIDIT